MDPRFARLHTDPRFVRPKASKNQLVVDERFKEFFDDSDPGASTSKGKKAHKVDKYGRPLAATAKSSELKRYYRFEDAPVAPAAEGAAEESEDESEGDEEPAAKSTVDLARGEGLEESSDEESAAASDSDSDSEGSVTLAPATLRRRRASPSRSPSIDLSENEGDAASDADVDADEGDEEIPEVDATKRIALVNLDWDHLRAVDLYRVLASSLSATALPPPAAPKPSKSASKKFDADGAEIGPYKAPSRLTLAQGRLLSLRIYPSSFGRERMEREEREGPPVEVLTARISDGEEDQSAMKMGRKDRKKRRARKEESDDEVTERDVQREQLEEGNEEDYDGEALRRYQLERLRYYYAVATFDTAAAASHVYGEIDGTEFERTANVFDLSFVPDETSFEDDPVHEEATEASVAAEGPAYQGVEFVTDALRHSKVKLTWDADDPHRKNKIASYLAQSIEAKGKGKGKTEVADDDIKAYLASSSDEDGSGHELPEDDDEDDFFEKKVDSTKTGKLGKRDQLRSLFGLDGGKEKIANALNWDGGKARKKGEGEMQITFAPALSDKKGAFGAEDDSDDDEGNAAARKQDETALETYKRKEKERRERKKLERKAKKDGVVLAPVGEEGPEFGGEDIGAGGFDDDFFADGDEEEQFAAFDAGEDLDENGKKKKRDARNGVKEPEKKLSKRARREAKEAEEEANKVAQASLALLVDSDDEDAEDGGRHFDMRSILKAEKNIGKKKGGKGRKGKSDEVVKKDTFEIDVKDDRFKGVYDDSNYAIDPTNPRFQKSRNMDALLSEGQKRRSNKRDARAPVGAPAPGGAKPKRAAEDGEDWRKLAETVKRKAGDVGGRGKRSKVET